MLEEKGVADMARTVRNTLEQARMRVLAYLADRAKENPGQGTSLGSVASELALAEGCRALSRFEGEGSPWLA